MPLFAGTYLNQRCICVNTNKSILAFLGGTSSQCNLREDNCNQASFLNKSQNGSSTILKQFCSKEIYASNSYPKSCNLEEGYADITTFSKIFVDKVILQVPASHASISEHDVCASSIMSQGGLNVNTADLQLPRTRQCVSQNRSKVQPSKKDKKQTLSPVSLNFQLEFSTADKLAIFPGVIIGKMIKECVSFRHFNHGNFNTIDVEISLPGRLVLQILNAVLKSYKLVDVVDSNRRTNSGVVYDKESKIDCMSNTACYTIRKSEFILKRKCCCRKQKNEAQSKSLGEVKSCVKQRDTTHCEGSASYPINLDPTQVEKDSVTNNKVSNATGITVRFPI